MKENLPYITAIIGFITLLLAIVGSAWLNQRALERQMDAFRGEVKAELKRLEEKLDLNLKQMNEKLDLNLKQMNERLSKIEEQLREIFKPVLPGSGR